jgi:methyl-accepting chemotaxis protein
VTSHVRSGVALVNETGSALETIIGRVDTVTASISTIAQTAGEQSLSLRKINGAVVEETNAATKNLTQQAVSFRTPSPAPA